jgi:hypothetical protein
LPDKNTAETDASSTVRDFKYSATIPIFNSLLVVPAIASQVSANFRIITQIPMALNQAGSGGSSRAESGPSSTIQ